MYKSKKFKLHNFKIVDIDRIQQNLGRCINCEARCHCGVTYGWLECKCSMTQHYINIQKERKQKIIKIYGNNI